MSALNPWHRGVVVAFDTETTGVDVTQDRIVSACVLTISPPAQMHERMWLVDPGIEIPTGATKVHGITTEHAREHGMAPAAALVDIVAALHAVWQAGWPVVGHNVKYDLSLLDHELRRYGLGSISSHGGPGMVVDTLALDRLIRPHWRGKRTLTDCAQAYDVGQVAAHDAKGDCITAARVAWRMAEAFPTVVQLDLHELMEQQRYAHQSWAEEFGAFLRSTGRVDDVEREWPYRTAAPLQVPA